MNKYAQITLSDRYTIYYERKQGKSCSVIAKKQGKHRSSIYRELSRNKCPAHGYYLIEKADSYARSRRSISRRNRYYNDNDFTVIRQYLRENWSPEQITGYLRSKSERSISHGLSINIYGAVK